MALLWGNLEVNLEILTLKLKSRYFSLFIKELKKMNIIERLGKKSNLTLINHGSNDLSTSYFLKSLVDHKESITNYYAANYLTHINTVENYIDLLFLDYIITYEGLLDLISEPYRSLTEELVYNSKEIRKEIKIKSIIDYINNNYEMLFKYDVLLLSEGIEKQTLNYIGKFHSGMKIAGIVAYLIKHKTILFMDNINSLYSIIKKHDKDLINGIYQNECQFKKVLQYRFEDICDFCLKVYQQKENELSHNIANKMFLSMRQEYESFNVDTQPYVLARKFKVLTNMLKELRNQNYEESKKIWEGMERFSDSYLLEHGRVKETEVSNRDHIDLIEQSKISKLPNMDKIMLLSHRFDESKLWVSVLEGLNNEYKSKSLVDYVTSMTDTDDYYTLSRQHLNWDFINVQSANISYWLSDSKVNDFFEEIKVIIKSIYSQIGHPGEIKDEIEYLKDAIININESNGRSRDYLIYHTVFFVITIIEKTLRNIFVHYDQDAIFNVNSITLSNLLSDNNDIIVNIVGKHHVKWLRFFLLKTNKIGDDLRNKMAHLRDINVGDLHIIDLYKALWLLTTTMNSIIVNLINKNFEVDM